MEELDTLATQKFWAQGSLQKPFTSIVTLYMHEQLSLEEAVREIVGVINSVFYGDGDDVDSYLLDLWLTILHISKKLPRPTTSPPDLPTPSQSRLLDLLSTLRRQTDPIPRPQIDTQNPIPDDPFADTPPPVPSYHSHNSSLNSTTTTTATTPLRQKQKITWSSLPRFLDAVKLALHDEPGRASGFSDLEALAWEHLVAFLALCARDQIVPDPSSGGHSGSEGLLGSGESRQSSSNSGLNSNLDKNEDEDAARKGARRDSEGEGTGGLDAVAVRMIKGALEVRHFPREALPSSSSSEDHHHHHHNHQQGNSNHPHWPTLFKSKKTQAKESEQRDHAAQEKQAQKAQTAEATKLNIYVAAAALWAVIMGEELWERQGQRVESPVGLSFDSNPNPPVSSPDGAGQAGKISRARWHMWIDRFQFMSLRVDLRMGTRELAAEAAAVMLRVG